MHTNKVKFSPSNANDYTDPTIEELRFYFSESDINHWDNGEGDATFSVSTSGPSGYIVMNVVRKALNEYLLIYNGPNWETLALTQNPNDMRLISFYSAQTHFRVPRSHLVSAEAAFRAAVTFCKTQGQRGPEEYWIRFGNLDPAETDEDFLERYENTRIL